MKKSIDFKKLTKISVIASVFSGIVGIGMAYNNFGVWSLVGYTISNKLFRLILYWTLNKWIEIDRVLFLQYRWHLEYQSQLI